MSIKWCTLRCIYFPLKMIEKIRQIHYPWDMESAMLTIPIGIMSDSHGKNDLLNSAIKLLRSLGAENLIHLGDMCDSLSPHIISQAFDILHKNNIKAVRGNNECTILHDIGTASKEYAPPEVVSLFSELPYTLKVGSVYFTHSAPYNYPAATKRPLSEFLPSLLGDESVPFTILFRGHSHRPSILDVSIQPPVKIPVQADKDISLDRNKRYIITVGAVESGSSVLFLPEKYMVRFIVVPEVSSKGCV